MNDAFVGAGRLHRPLAPLVLPAVYDDVLSYEEWLSKVVARCNELSTLIETTMDNIEEEVSGMVDARIDVHLNERLQPIQTEIAQLQSDLTTAVENLNEQIDSLDGKIDRETASVYNRLNTQIQTVTNRISSVQSQLNGRIDNIDMDLRAYTDEKFLQSQNEINRKISELKVRINLNLAELSARIDAIIKEYPRLYDPASGFSEDMQTLIYTLYRRLRYYGLEALLYDDQELTAEEYDNESYTAIKYDTLIGRFLFKELREMFNPFTGKYESVRDVVSMLVRKLQWNGKTAGEYDGYEATAGEFDSSDFNAYEQDTNQYIETTTPDTKNKSYRNWLYVGTGVTITVPKVVVSNANAFYTFDNGEAFEFPIARGTYGGFVVDDTDPDVYEITSVHNTPLYAVTRVFDVNELDK